MKKQSVCGNFEADFSEIFAVIQPLLHSFKVIVAQSAAMTLKLGDKYQKNASFCCNNQNNTGIYVAVVVL